MKITKLLAKDIYGIEGQREYDLDGCIVGVFGENGVGKSSFLKSLDFAISGVKTPGITHEGTAQGAVMFETDNGLRVDRLVERKPSGTVTITNWMNRKKSPAINIQKEIASDWDTKPENLKVLSSKDLEESLSKDAGKILLSYADDTLTADEVRELLKKSITEKDHIISEDIDTIKLPETIDAQAAKKISDSAAVARRQAKSDGKSLVALRNSISMQPLPEDAPDAVSAKSELDSIIAYEAKAAEAGKLLEEYNKNTAHRNELLKEITELKGQIAKLDPDSTAGDAEKLRTEREALIEKGNAVKAKKTAAEATIQALSPIHDRLGTGVCPLWDKIKCSTDMTGAKAQIKADIEKAGKEAEEAAQELGRMKADYEKLMVRLGTAEKAAMLKTKLEAMERSLPPEPVKPEVTKPQDHTERKKLLQAVIDNASKKAQLVKIDDDIRKQSRLVYLTDFTAKAFSEKGSVVSRILEMYLDRLTEAAGKAEADTGVGVVFSYDNGLKINYRVRNDTLRPYETLSSGEQALAFLTVSDLLHRIASIPVLVLDNLDRLDLKNLDRMLSLLDRVKDSYENIILAGVSHNGVREVLEKHGIENLLETDTPAGSDNEVS